MTSYEDGIYQNSGRRRTYRMQVDTSHLYSHRSESGYIFSDPVRRPTEDEVIENCILDAGRKSSKPSAKPAPNYIYYDVKNKRYVRPSTEPETYRETPLERRQRIQANIDKTNSSEWLEDYAQRREAAEKRRQARKAAREAQEARREAQRQQHTKSLIEDIKQAIQHGSFHDISFAWWMLENHMGREIPHIVVTLQHQIFRNSDVQYWICKSLILNYLPSQYHWMIDRYKSA